MQRRYSLTKTNQISLQPQSSNLRSLQRNNGGGNNGRNNNGGGNGGGNNGGGNGGGRRPFKQSCVLAVADIQYSDHTTAEPEDVECELQGEDRPNGQAKLVKVKGINRAWVKANKAESGMTTIFAEGADVDLDTDELILPENPRVQVRCLILSRLMSCLF